MINNRLLTSTARTSSRGGFTLVELLVVIGIIAILAASALGPIMGGIQKARQSSGVQTARTLALAEFQYSNDNNQVYPNGADAGIIATALVAGGYASDPGIFTISGAQEKKYTGANSKTAFPVASCSWNFGQTSATVGMTANAPDQSPLVMSAGGGQAIGGALAAAGAVTGTVAANNPFGVTGAVICYKSNSSKWLPSSTVTPGQVQVEDGSWPGYTMVFALGNNG